MSKGIKSKQSERFGGFAKEIIGMGLMLFSVLSLLCLITGDVIFYTVGRYVQGFFFGLFGYYSFIVLGLTVLLGLRLLIGRSVLPADVKGKFALVCLFLFSVLAIVQTATSFSKAATFSENWTKAYGGGQCGFSTATMLGAASLLLINPLGSLISSVGCYILFSLLTVLFTCLIFKEQIGRNLNKKKKKAKAVKTKPEQKKKEAKPVKETDGNENSSLETVKTTADEGEEETPYRRPDYVGAFGDFNMKTKRDYSKEGRQINVFDGNFTLRNGKNSSYSSESYSTKYRRDLSPEARYIMSPPPVRPEDIGQPPIKANNPSSDFAGTRREAPEYDDYALGGSVYTVSDRKNEYGNSSNNLGYSGSGYEHETRGGLFDNTDTERSKNLGGDRFGRGLGGDAFDRNTSRGLSGDAFDRNTNGRSLNNDRPAYTHDERTRDIEERLGVDRGKRQVPDGGLDDGGFSSRREDNYSFGGDIPNVENAYNPADHARKGGLFDSETEPEKTSHGSNEGLFGTAFQSDRGENLRRTNVPDMNADSDVMFNENYSSVSAERETTSSARTSSVSRFQGGGLDEKEQQKDRAPRSDIGGTHLRTAKVGEANTKQDDESEYTSSTVSEISKFSDDYDPNEGYASIEDMPMNYRYVKPTTDLLADVYVDESKVLIERQRLMDLARLVETNFAKRGVTVRLENIVYGMTITRFEYSIPTETSVKVFTQNQGDIAVWLHAKGEIRILAPIPGTSKIGIEVPNQVRSTVGLKELICSTQYRKIKKDGIYIPAGKNVMAEPVFLNLTDMPHLLIAGATGKGKSVFLNAMLVSLMYTYSPEDLRIVIVDPKQLEFVSFEGIPHLLFNKIITKAEEAAALLNYLVKEMEDRYTLFARAKVKKIAHYNEAIDKRTTKKLPYIIVLIDEFADLMMKNPAAKKDMDQSITRLAQLARAAGISLVFATQRPTTDVIDGTIKNNFPARICFKTADYTNSQVVIGENGAEKLLGKGDLLYKIDGPTERAQGALVEDSEIERVVSFVNEHNKCYYDKKLFEYINKMAKCFGQTQSAEREGQISMDLGESGNPADMPVVYRRAVRLVIVQNTTSKSMLQTKLGIGYNKAARIIDWMEKQGFISCVLDNKQREIRIDRATYEQVFGEAFEEDYTK